MLELLNQVRPELLMSWTAFIILSLVLLINAYVNSKPKKNVYIPYKNSKGETVGHVNFVSYDLKK